MKIYIYAILLSLCTTAAQGALTSTPIHPKKKVSTSQKLARALCKNDCKAFEELLQKHPQKLNQQSANKKNSLLHFAVRENKPEILRVLLSFEGININSKDNSGNTPLHIAYQLANVTCIKVLLEHGADRTAKNKLQETPRDVARFADLWNL